VKEESGCAAAFVNLCCRQQPCVSRVAIRWREHVLMRWAMERGDADSAYDVVDDAAEGDDAASISRWFSSRSLWFSASTR
jgi:hypothetical protein